MTKTKFLAGVSALGICALGIATAQADTTTQSPATLGTITVFAKGAARQTQTITHARMIQAAPGTSPIKVLAQLPGVNYQSADAFGAYEWATRISVRGFSQNQMGFTLDDVPLGDMSYGNWNGLHISRAIIDENIAKATLTQGPGGLGVASNSDLGAAIQFTSADPTMTPGATAAQSFGSNDDLRTYVALNTGELPSDTRIELSVVRQSNEKWRGIGGQRYSQVNLKAVQDIGPATLTGFFNYSNRAEVDYQDVSKEYVSKLGYNWDNYGQWGESIAAAEGVYTHGENTTSDPLDAAYYAGSGLRRDALAGLTLETPITDQLSLKSTFYYHRDEGRGLWYTPYTASPDGSPISLRTSEYTEDRAGLNSALTYKLTSADTITGGFWVEREAFDLARRFYATTLTSPVYSLYDFPTNPFATQWAFKFDIGVYQGYIQNSYKITDQLTLTAGFKGTDTAIGSKQVVGTGYASGDISAHNPFLPQVGLNYALTPSDEFFADFSENLRAFQAGGPGYGAAPFQVSQSVFDETKDGLKPETSYTYELGYRLKRPGFSGDADVYHVDFHDRLLAIAECAGIIGCPNALANVGAVTSDGAEIAGTAFLPFGFTWYNAASADQSKYDDNINSGGVEYTTKNKQAVDTPKFIYSTDFGYRYDGFYAHVTGNAESGRYYSYTNDASVPGYMTWDLSAGYDMPRVGVLKGVRFQLNMTNIFSKKYFSSIGTNGFVLNDPTGEAQTLQVAQPRAVFGTVSASF
jgi:iron complex outermembrane receptor protein